MYHSTHVEVRRQFAGASSTLILCRSWGPNFKSWVLEFTFTIHKPQPHESTLNLWCLQHSIGTEMGLFTYLAHIVAGAFDCGIDATSSNRILSQLPWSSSGVERHGAGESHWDPTQHSTAGPVSIVKSGDGREGAKRRTTPTCNPEALETTVITFLLGKNRRIMKHSSHRFIVKISNLVNRK